MTLSPAPLRPDPSHDAPEMIRGRMRCPSCLRPYQYEAETGRYTGEPSGWSDGLKRSGQMKRTRLRQVSPDRERKRADRGVFGELCDYVRGRTCVGRNCHQPGEPHHVRSRGAGFGDWLPNGDGNVVPLCRREHNRLHAQGRETFKANEGLDLAHEARRIGREYES